MSKFMGRSNWTGADIEGYKKECPVKNCQYDGIQCKPNEACRWLGKEVVEHGKVTVG